MKNEVHEWGYFPEDVEPKQWWGCRAIISKGVLDIPPDRVGYDQGDASAAEKEAFFAWASGPMDTALRKEVKARRFRNWEDYFEMYSEDGRFRCKATPKNSMGDYLYVGVWQVPDSPK